MADHITALPASEVMHELDQEKHANLELEDDHNGWRRIAKKVEGPLKGRTNAPDILPSRLTASITGVQIHTHYLYVYLCPTAF